MFALAVDGHAVAVCCSVRRTSMAHEAGVETVSPYRGRGYAARVVKAWARAVREARFVTDSSTDPRRADGYPTGPGRCAARSDRSPLSLGAQEV